MYRSKEPEQNVISTQKSSRFITQISVKLTAYIFGFLRLQDLVYCQRVNKLFHNNSLKAIQADKAKYAMYCVKQNNIDIDNYFDIEHFVLSKLNNSSKADNKNQSKDNSDKKSRESENATEKDQTENTSNLSLIRSRVDELVEAASNIKDALSNQESVEYILKNLIDVVKPNKIFHGLQALSQPNDDDTFISIEFPHSVIDIGRFPRTKIRADILFGIAGIEDCDMKNYLVGFQAKQRNRWQQIEYELSIWDAQYNDRVLQREIMRIILTNDKVLEYFNLKSQNGKKEKNLLLLDWDETLYHHNIQRPHLIQFLQCVTKFCVIFINTAGCGKEQYIRDLNQHEGVDICGIFNLSRRKQWLNEWIKRYHWCNIDEKHLNFLLIDDDLKIGTNLLNAPEFKGCSKDDVLLKLIPWLEEWYKYTTTNKKGTTNQYIKYHPISFAN